jgi:lysozyme
LDGAITAQYAEQLLSFQLTTAYLPQVQRLCPAIDTPQRLAAILDFAYNLGASNLKNSTLRRCINAGDWDAVPAQLMRWNRGGGRVLAGLTKRRAAEAALI